MSERPRVSRRAVAALFIERQHLDRPLGRRLTATSLKRFAEDVGGIQLDSINVVDRAHHLTLWSRFGPFDRRAFERLAYRRHAMFEYWAHAACLVPIADFTAWRRAMLDYSTRNRSWSKFLKKHQKTIAEVEAAFHARGGPLGNADFQHPDGRPARSPGWWNWRPTTHALDYLWMSGRTAVHSRVHFQKRFDLIERVLPETALEREPLGREQFPRWHLRRSLHAMGAATEIDLRLYLTFPRMARSDRQAALRAALDEGEVIEIEVPECRGRWLALAEDLPALARAARRRRPASGSAMLAPFDSFLWHRERTERLFGFEYRIEVYTPGHKRVHGYYTLPIYHEGQLIGRLDPKTHRDAKRLEVRNVHFEPWFVKGEPPPAASWGALDREAAIAGVATAIRSLATFVHAERIDVGRVTPAAIDKPLRRAIG